MIIIEFIVREYGHIHVFLDINGSTVILSLSFVPISLTNKPSCFVRSLVQKQKSKAYDKFRYHRRKKSTEAIL